MMKRAGKWAAHQGIKLHIATNGQYDVRRYEVHSITDEVFLPQMFNLNQIKFLDLTSNLQEIQGLEGQKCHHEKIVKSRMWDIL